MTKRISFRATIAILLLAWPALGQPPRNLLEIDATLQSVVDGLCNGDVSTCATVVGPVGPAGADGKSCTVTQNEGSATISCTDGTSAGVSDGEQGPAGEKGDAGGSCTVTQQNGSATITCDDGTTAMVSDGEPGPPGPGVDPAQLESLCVAADMRGDTYRPTFCEARCDCLDPVRSGLDQLPSCAEVAPGHFSATLLSEGTPGQCEEVPCPPGSFLEDGQCCTLATGIMCPFGTGCPPGQLCFNGFCIGSETICVGAPGSYCNTSSNTDCDVHACPSGEVERVSMDRCFCVKPCSSDDACGYLVPPDIVLAVSLSGLSSPDQIEPAQCSVTPGGIKQTNGNDALKCLEELETAIGAPCTRLP